MTDATLLSRPDRRGRLQRCHPTLHQRRVLRRRRHVYFPAGTYAISFAGAGRSNSTSIFVVPSNITLAGHAQSDTTIRLAPNQGDYHYIFDVAYSGSNVVFQDFTLDYNGLNTGGNLPNYTTNLRMAIVFINGVNNVVQRCRFTNIVADCTIAIYGGCSTMLSHNTFDNVGLNTTNKASIFRHSTDLHGRCPCRRWNQILSQGVS